jgi:hypothetical protein
VGPRRGGIVRLLDRIFRFAGFYFARSLTTDHLRVIRSEFPDPGAFALGEALIRSQWEFGAFFADSLVAFASDSRATRD